MQLALTSKAVDYSVLWNINRNRVLRDAILIGCGSLLIAIGAKISIPLQPVPITLQSLAVLFIGMTYGFRLGVMTVGAYLIAGISGLPVFALASGPLVLHVGYLVGFLLSVAMTGFLTERGWARHLFSTTVATLLGSVVILFCGWIVLAQFLGPYNAFAVGIKPFILDDSLKVIFLSCVVPHFWRSVKPKKS